MRKNPENLGINPFIKLLSFFAFLFIPFLGFTQIRVTGKVTDVNGNALIGVNVIMSDTRQGTITNKEGEFQLTASDKNVTIEFSYVGFQTETVPLNGRTYLEVSLQESSELLEEVVVVGYGTVKKRDLTGLSLR